MAHRQHGGSTWELVWDPEITLLGSPTIVRYDGASLDFQETTPGIIGVSPTVKQFLEELSEFTQYMIVLLIDSIHDLMYVSTSQGNTLSTRHFMPSMLEWNPGTITSSSLVQPVAPLVVRALLEDKQFLGREDCHVHNIGFPILQLKMTPRLVCDVSFHVSDPENVEVDQLILVNLRQLV